MFDFRLLARAMMREARGKEESEVCFPAEYDKHHGVFVRFWRDHRGRGWYDIGDGFGNVVDGNGQALAEEDLANAIREWLDIYTADGTITEDEADALKREALVTYAGVVWTPPTA